MIITSFLQMLPILLVLGAGYLYATFVKVDVSALVRITSDVFMPALVFYSVTRTALTSSDFLAVSGASALIFTLLLAFGWLWLKVTGENQRSTLPAIVFMNSGFLGYPLMQLYGGADALNVIVIFDQVQGIFLFTIGLFIITGGFSKKSIQSLIHSPIIWAMGASFAILFLGIPLPNALERSFSFVADAASPIACFALGVSIKQTPFTFHRNVIGSLLFRFGGGYLIAWLVTVLFGITGMAQTVLIISASLPSAMLASILPLRYGLDNQHASMMVVISTLLGIVTIPLAFALAG